MQVQLTFWAGTRPSEVGGLNVQLHVSVLDPCVMVTVALVNAMSVIVSVQLGLEQSGAPATLVLGKTASTANDAFPFLSMSSGVSVSVPVTVTGAGFWPGGRWVSDPGFWHVAVGFPVAESSTTRVSFPNPASSPLVRRSVPRSKNVGTLWSPLMWISTAPASEAISATARPIRLARFMLDLLLR